LHVDEQLGSFEIARSNTHVVLLARVVELGQAPVDEAELAVRMVDHDVVGLNITMHDALGVAVVKCLQDFKHVEPDVKVVETLVELAEVSVARVNELGDDGRRLGQRITGDADHIDDVSSSLQSLKDFELSPNLVLLHCSKNIESLSTK